MLDTLNVIKKPPISRPPMVKESFTLIINPLLLPKNPLELNPPFQETPIDIIPPRVQPTFYRPLRKVQKKIYEMKYHPLLKRRSLIV